MPEKPIPVEGLFSPHDAATAKTMAPVLHEKITMLLEQNPPGHHILIFIEFADMPPQQSEQVYERVSQGESLLMAVVTATLPTTPGDDPMFPHRRPERIAPKPILEPWEEDMSKQNMAFFQAQVGIIDPLLQTYPGRIRVLPEANIHADQVTDILRTYKENMDGVKKSVLKGDFSQGVSYLQKALSQLVELDTTREAAWIEQIKAHITPETSAIIIPAGTAHTMVMMQLEDERFVKQSQIIKESYENSPLLSEPRFALMHKMKLNPQIQPTALEWQQTAIAAVLFDGMHKTLKTLHPHYILATVYRVMGEHFSSEQVIEELGRKIKRASKAADGEGAFFDVIIKSTDALHALFEEEIENQNNT